MNEAQILLLTAASIAFLHTILGPDHYLPFVALGKARKWSLAKTLRITLYCGLGHVLSSVVIGGVGIVLGTKKALSLAVTRAESRERTTTLSERLKELR